MLQVEPAIVSCLVRSPRGAITRERLLRRARDLPEVDRLIMDLAFRSRVSHRQIGMLLGLSTGSVCRRVRKLSALLTDPLVVALIEDRQTLSPEQREVGLEHFVQRRSIRALAHRRGVPQAHVARIIEYIRAWHKLKTR